MKSTDGQIQEGTEPLAASSQRGGLSTATASLSRLLSIAGLSFWFIVVVNAFKPEPFGQIT